MERRKALKVLTSGVITAGVGYAGFKAAFKNEANKRKELKEVKYTANDSAWNYSPLDPKEVAQCAYNEFNKKACMYGVFSGLITQLASKVGAPFDTFPKEMMGYGHGGIGGYGTTCGTLNGAAAIIGLVVKEKEVQDMLISHLFKWYEQSSLPNFVPANSVEDYTPPKSEAHSPLCHASTTRWGKVSGYKIATPQRKERCRRLTADVAAQTAVLLNSYYENTFVANQYDDETERTCMTCHGKTGKVGNTSGMMSCESCHDKSIAHKVFADPHYKLMD